jgi:hypothetical protein
MTVNHKSEMSMMFVVTTLAANGGEMFRRDIEEAKTNHPLSDQIVLQAGIDYGVAQGIIVNDPKFVGNRTRVALA